MKGKDASDMLCVLYKKMADVKKEMRELEVLVGNVELQELRVFYRIRHDLLILNDICNANAIVNAIDDDNK